MNARPPVNLSAMTVLFGVDDKKLFSRILNRFIGPENSKVFDAICAAIDVGNISVAFSEAHKLKSASRVVGADALADVFERVKEACRK
jgi:HPt (histidine-containing phosphotransfer) domain-containing protein